MAITQAIANSFKKQLLDGDMDFKHNDYISSKYLGL